MHEQSNLSYFIPGFAMGLTRSLISHPFEILKIKSQLNVNNNISIFKGLHYSLLASGIERGLQFGLYDFFKKNDNNFISSIKSASLSTFISIPYNFYIVNKTVINQPINFSIRNLSKIVPIEYTRTSLGSFIFLYTYNDLKSKEIPLWISAFSGTTVVWLVTYPFDNIRNQIISKRHNFKFNNLYKGIHYPILRSIPSSIIGMYVYEKVKNFFET